MTSPTPSLTLTNTETTLSNEGSAPQDLKSTLTKSGFTGKSTRRIAEVDDEEGKAQFFLTLLFER